MNPRFKPFLILLLIGLLAEAVFLAWPEIDLNVSRMYWDPGSKSFPLAYDPDLRTVQKGVERFARFGSIFLVGCFLSGLFASVLPRAWMRLIPLPPKQALFLIFALAIGPGLVVHAVFKDGFGRPRPDEIIEFGGAKHFEGPFVISGEHGQSFVSGHAAVGFYLSALAFVAVRRKAKPAVYAGGILAGLGVGACRIMQGRHFLSDVIFAGIVTLIVIHALWAFFEWWERRGMNARLSEWWKRRASAPPRP